MSKTELTLLYHAIHQDPNAAARMVEQLADEELVTLFAKLPAHHTAQLFMALLPHFQAKIASQLADHTLRLLCDHMSGDHLASLLRASDETTTQKIFSLLTPRQQRNVVKVIDYPDTTIGAWVLPGIIPISENYSCQQAYQKAISMPSELAWVVLVDNQQQLVGKVAIAMLFKERQSSQVVQTIMQPLPMPLPAKLSLLQAIKHPCWQTEDWMPVINTHQGFIGVLSEKQLKKALYTVQQRITEPTPDSMSALSGWYGDNLFAFAKLLLGYLRGNGL